MDHRRIGLSLFLVVLGGLGLGACGGSAEPEPKLPPPPTRPEERPDPSWEVEGSAPAAVATEEEPPAPIEKTCPEPEFKAEATVNDALSAVDSCWSFQGIEPDVLSAPLRDPELLKPCKLQSTHKFKLRLAVWDGRVVGVDVQSANQKLAKCIDEQVRTLTYDEKFKAINTVEYSF